VSDFASQVVSVNTGSEAVKACKANPDLDLVLMDIRMPGTNGYHATKKIREFNKNVVIIAQTAFAFTGDKERSIVAGCNDYIPKPLNKEEIEQIILKYFLN
jgi:CheY-like chemotaxis protein